MPPTLERTTFATNRILEFFSEKELRMQIGHPVELWPVALVKELIDNALDASENAGIAPVIEVTLEDDAVTIQDNGPGLPLDTLMQSMNYLIRVSDKAFYVSPTRGQLGNALKCVWAAPFVVDGERGSVEVVTGDVHHHIDVTMDRIAQTPNLRHTSGPNGVVRKGTLIKMHWSEIASYLTGDGLSGFYKEATIHRLCTNYTLFNPHLSMKLILWDSEWRLAEGSVGEWRKWRPSDPTSPHWYTPERLRALIAAYLAREREGARRRTVRGFVSEFDGLRGTAKQKAVTDAAGLSGSELQDLVHDDDVEIDAVECLLDAMQSEARPIKPSVLGVIGKEHLHERMVSTMGVNPNRTWYRKVEDTADGIPFVLEVAFGILGSGYEDSARMIATGINWTPTIGMPFRELNRMLEEVRVYEHDPVAVVVHLACPSVDYVDRGKTILALPDEIGNALGEALCSVTKRWVDAQRQRDRENRVRERAIEKLTKAEKPEKVSLKDAACAVMEQAYLKASADGTLPANARQIMYAARPLVLKLTGGECWDNSSYFTQTLLPNFMLERREQTTSWDVVFDARGHLREPHTELSVGIGTLEIRRHTASWQEPLPDAVNVSLDHAFPTCGPRNRYEFALFIEKEGFDELLKRGQIAERFDVMIFSTKGLPVTAARALAERLAEQGVTILVLHDFDKSGLNILHALQHDNRRYRFRTRPKVIDLGLRLSDIEEMELETEAVDYDSKVDPRVKLREYGATEAECNFLVTGRKGKGWTGQRGELNAMYSPVMLEFTARKLIAAGVRKVVPGLEVLMDAYRRAHRRALIQEAIDQAILESQEMADDDIEVPANIEMTIAGKLDGTARAWDDVLWEIVMDQREEERSDIE